MPGESLVVHQVSKRFSPQFSFTDIGVAVDTGAKPLPRVVEVEDPETIQPDRVVEHLHSRGILRRITDVVARGKDVAGVEADRNARLVFHKRQNPGELFEGTTHG